MLVHVRTLIGSPAGNNSLYSIFSPLRNQKRPKLSQTLTLKMVSQSNSKRPMCPSCSKPSSICLCTRLKTPSLENSVGVTILQHSLEKKHPLNSTRIATLGLKNVNVVSVSDVHHEAQFVISLLEPDCEMGSVSFEAKNTNYCGIHDYKHFQSNIESERLVNLEKKETNLTSTSEECSSRSDFGSDTEHKLDGKQAIEAKGTCALEANQNYLFRETDIEMVSDCSTLDEVVFDEKTEVAREIKVSQLGFFDPIGLVPICIDEPALTLTISKYGLISSLTHHLKPLSQLDKPNVDRLLASLVGLDASAKGFVVKKLQKKQLEKSIEYDECEEFEIMVPPGSVLLFPSEKSVGIEAIDFEVKNLIVLDGTWAKAKRIYSENPWLKVLPHLKLDLDKMSLYSEVRQQPKAGFLSTIESIVYALKAVGDYPEGLDGLLDVFESMVGDQRRCKDERLNNVSLG